MEGKQEKTKFRPNESDFNEKIHYIRKSKQSDQEAYDGYVFEIGLYSKGDGEQDTKDQFYPGWTQEDFSTLLEKLEQEGLL